MSRWLEDFEAHAFQGMWRDLKIELEKTTVDDKTVITSVSELARLQKVVSYLDEMIQSIDPELVPTGIWDNFNSQATPCLQQIVSYNANRNIAHIQKANIHVDNLLTYIRPYMVASGKIGKVLQEAIRAYAKTITEFGESFRNKSLTLVEETKSYANESRELCDSIEKIKNLAEEYNVKLFGIDESDGGIYDKVNKLVIELEEKYVNITDFYNETLVGTEKTPATKKEILQAKETILAERKSIKGLLDDVSIEVDQLKQFYIKIFGKHHDDDEKEDGGLSGEFNELIKALADFEVKQRNKYMALNDQIEALLPGATSAGLATAYLEMKASFNDPIKSMSHLFYGSIGILVFGSIILAIDTVGPDSITFIKVNDWNMVLQELVYKIPFYAPILWLAFYASKRRSEYQRLQQEYAHKEALAKSYDSYKKQIEQLDVEDKTMQKELITKAVDAIAYNASNTLDKKHGDKMPTLVLIEKTVEQLEKFKNIFKSS